MDIYEVDTSVSIQLILLKLAISTSAIVPSYKCPLTIDLYKLRNSFRKIPPYHSIFFSVENYELSDLSLSLNHTSL